MKSIGKEIRSIIKKKNISLYQIAKDLGVTWESLYRSLLGGANPEWKRIGQILDYLNYDFVLKPKRKEVKPEKSKPPQSRRKERESHGSIQKKK
jgi:transcriptional regulator with XRE-family HTH domain